MHFLNKVSVILFITQTLYCFYLQTLSRQCIALNSSITGVRSAYVLSFLSIILTVVFYLIQKKSLLSMLHNYFVCGMWCVCECVFVSYICVVYVCLHAKEGICGNVSKNLRVHVIWQCILHPFGVCVML